jgi:predicted nucleic acid-binding protein
VVTREEEAILVIDERRGTNIARGLGLTTIGIVGVIGILKSRGLIPEGRPWLDALERDGFYLARDLRERSLRLMGESDA